MNLRAVNKLVHVDSTYLDSQCKQLISPVNVPYFMCTGEREREREREILAGQFLASINMFSFRR